MTRIHPEAPYYPFEISNTSHIKEYHGFHRLETIPLKMAMSIKTDYDAFTLADTKKELLTRLHYIKALTKEDLVTKYNLKTKSQGSSWSLDDIVREFKSLPDKYSFLPRIYLILHSPMVFKYMYYHQHTALIGVKQYPVHRHLLDIPGNYALLFTKVTASTPAHSPFMTSHLPSVHALATGTGSCNFTYPLYLDTTTLDTPQRLPNFSRDFMRAITTAYNFTPTPEQIFAYLYAVLWHKEYRTRYLPFLSLDFPRIPLVKSQVRFIKLARAGQKLITLHLNIPIPPHQMM